MFTSTIPSDYNERVYTYRLEDKDNAYLVRKSDKEIQTRCLLMPFAKEDYSATLSHLHFIG